MAIDTFANELLLRQRLTLDNADQERLAQAVVAFAGLGGIGCPAVEVMARNALGYFRLADLDQYEYSNARQLFMTHESVGRHKVDAGRARVLAINPSAQVDVYYHGINPTSYHALCEGADVICNEVDQLAYILTIQYAASRFRIPVVHACRTRWQEGHFLGGKIFDYRDPATHFDVTSFDVETKWGVQEKLIRELFDHLAQERACPDLIQEINTQNKLFRIKTMREVIEHGDTAGISDKSREHLLHIAEEHPETFYKMAISPEEAIIMGCMYGTAIKDLLLGRSPVPIEINLYHGIAHTLHQESPQHLQRMQCTIARAA